MESVGLSEKKRVMNVLTQGMEFANELKRKLPPNANSTTQACDVLLDSVVSSYQNAMALLGNGDSSHLSLNNFCKSPNSIEAISEGSDLTQQQKFKKRKTLPKWSEQVRVSSGMGGEGQLDDGYNWRKYGQKDILGANHPRAYYRCSHRNTQGCLATKQVQRADEDSSMFEIIYRGKHSCRQEKKDKVGDMKMMKSTNRCDELIKEMSSEQVELIKEDYFSFPSTPTPGPEDVFLTNFVATTPDSFFSLSPCPCPCPLNDYLSSDSDFGEIISNPTPLAFTFDDLDFLDQLL